MPDLPTLPMLATAACALATAWLVGVEHRLAAAAGAGAALPVQRGLAKMLASSAFVMLALVGGAWASSYGRWVLAALAWSWLGDALLLSPRRAAFLAGMGAFALAHAAYSFAFARAGVQMAALLLGAAAMLAVGLLALRWLRPHLPAGMLGPVTVYVAIIGAMVALALGHGAASGRWAVPLGAAMFAASDLGVARQQFVRRQWRNPAIALPLYFGAQLLLAASAGTAGGVAPG